MRLLNAHITKFRCVNDSTSFSVGSVTCLVGKNESGKTSVLHALERLNPIDPDDTYLDKLRDYPRHLLADFSENESALVTDWQLDDDDVAALEEVLGPEVVTSRKVEITLRYTNRRSYTVPIDQRKVVAWLLDEAACNVAEKKQFSACSTTRELKQKLDAITEKSVRVQGLLESIATFQEGDASLAAIDLLHKRLPKFLYFASYDRMNGNVHLETLAKRKANNQSTREDEVFVAFLEYAGTSLDEIRKLNTYEAIKARVEGASIKISKQIFAYWSQNRHLKVEFSVELGREGDEPPYNTGTVMRTRIHNKLHEMTVPFDDRSAGFICFSSFLVMFSQVRRMYGNVVILLDEPGLNLHGRAQADLVRFIYEKLRDQHQVTYTTHSPFMVPSDDLAAIRTVEDVIKRLPDDEIQVLGTKVGDEVLSSDKDTLFPLQGALGYEITQSLFVGKHTLVVEGPSDILYLQAASARLRQLGREALDLRWTICPSGGVDKVAAFVSLFAGNKLHVAVLADIAHGQKGKVETLRRSSLLNEGHVLTVAEFCEQEEADIEDLFGPEVYVELVNQALALKGKNRLGLQSLASGGEASLRIVKRVEAALRLLPTAPDFNHFAPASWLLGNPGFLTHDSADTKAALDRFESLFGSLNALLPPR